MSAPRRVLVTGAAGFIGSHVARVLLTAGRDVAIVVRPGSSVSRLQDIIECLTIISADLADAEELRPALATWRPDACIHLAWYAGHGDIQTAPENVQSLITSLGLLDELIRSGCGQVVMAGTCAEYDTAAGYLREDGPTRPLTLYGATKLACGVVAGQIAAAAGINLAWARLFYLFGPDQHEQRLVPAVIRALSSGEEFPATTGNQVRDYLHVEDVASALWALAEQRVSGTVNVCSGIPVTIRHLTKTVGEIVGGEDLIRFGTLPYREWDPPFICGDNQRLRATTAWQPRYTTLEAGLAQTVACWLARQAR